MIVTHINHYLPCTVFSKEQSRTTFLLWLFDIDAHVKVWVSGLGHGKLYDCKGWWKNCVKLAGRSKMGAELTLNLCLGRGCVTNNDPVVTKDWDTQKSVGWGSYTGKKMCEFGFYCLNSWRHFPSSHDSCGISQDKYFKSLIYPFLI